MLKRLKKKIIKSLMVIILFTSLGFYGAYKVLVEDDKPKTSTFLPADETIKLSFISEESLVNKIHNVQRLVPLEVELNERIIIDSSWGDFEVFKKLQRIEYYIKGTYSVDLSTLENSNIKIDKLNKKIQITLPKPVVDSIIINQDKTIFETTENGLLRIGDIKLTPDEYAIIEKEIINRIEKKLKEQSLYNESIKKTEEVVKSIVRSTVPGDFNLTIKFE
ncbi:hypothetical protein CPJCM30710_19860 [Clostridium polyendosporum]|uniref:DUF4230 domain-containing protein n=1 Tax=Clostridium polyendosporum TaxID=69208 RepID=A0A919S1A0_9CLOT|nr:DUF4230 domain-containing protein [Clostridium polyendosporum]GIM29320.1 hypothetical protein CPJCM30710_19860 [Clostridium polyendosporum]